MKRLSFGRRSQVALGVILGMAGLLAFALACGTQEEETPAVQQPAPVPTVDVAAIINQALQAQPQPETMSPADVAKAVQDTMAAQPGVTQADVAQAIAEALEARPGVTQGDVADAIAKAMAAQPQQEGLTEADVARTIADALARQTPGLTEAEVGSAIAKAMAERPGVSQDDIQAAVAQAMETQQTMMPERMSTTITVVLDNVGAPQFRNEKGTWPDVMFHGFFGFQEPLLGWTPSEDDMGNPLVNRDSCSAPLVITGWEWELPSKDYSTMIRLDRDLKGIDDAMLSREDTFVVVPKAERAEPDNEGIVRLFIRPGIDFYRAGDDGELVNMHELTAEDVVWSMNDAGSDNPNTAHSNSSQNYEFYKKWEVEDKYTAVAPNRAFTSDGLSNTSSQCWDAVFMQSKSYHDELLAEGNEFGSFGFPHGSGPFVVHQWRPNERIDTEARVDHWRANAPYDNLVILQANEAQTRSGMLQTGLADIAMASIQDVARLEKEGFRFHDGLDTIYGNFFYFAGNYYSFKDPETDESVLREGFRPSASYPWIGDPRLECVGIDRTDPAIQDAPGAGCDAQGFDNKDTDRFDYNTPSMLSARAFRLALIHAIDRELIASSVTGGYGGAVYGGSYPGIGVHQLHPEYKDKWDYPFDPTKAQGFLQESGVPDGFEFEFFCSQGNGTSLEVCEATVGQWKENLGLNPYIDSQQYSARRPTMLARQIYVPWMTRWGPTSKQGRISDLGGTLPGGGLWPLPSGGYNPGLEDNLYYDFREETRVQAKGSEDNLASREKIIDRAHYWGLTGGVVEVPVLIGFNPDTVQSWDLKPWDLVNSFETVLPTRR